MPRVQKFIPRANEIQALQNIGGPQDITITDFSRFSGVSDIRVEKGGAVAVGLKEGSLNVPIGHWLVIESDMLTVYPDVFMKSKFIPLP
jgi:hypothetical protein